ncbi:hypothetical protein H4219_006150 [Mycoemilia scoparia]|uniref:Uncharacterized protein n=1 Tax=Mycoemilia scoparia TaxID=417184 RepID=A0A9W7ZR91_9FUNG|nr:hypothetical protein H4219_006150 [Mycoemilia scoparia]
MMEGSSDIIQSGTTSNTNRKKNHSLKSFIMEKPLGISGSVQKVIRRLSLPNLRTRIQRRNNSNRIPQVIDEVATTDSFFIDEPGTYSFSNNDNSNSLRRHLENLNQTQSSSGFGRYVDQNGQTVSHVTSSAPSSAHLNSSEVSHVSGSTSGGQPRPPLSISTEAFGGRKDRSQSLGDKVMSTSAGSDGNNNDSHHHQYHSMPLESSIQEDDVEVDPVFLTLDSLRPTIEQQPAVILDPHGETSPTSSFHEQRVIDALHSFNMPNPEPQDTLQKPYDDTAYDYPMPEFVRIYQWIANQEETRLDGLYKQRSSSSNSNGGRPHQILDSEYGSGFNLNDLKTASAGISLPDLRTAAYQENFSTSAVAADEFISFINDYRSELSKLIKRMTLCSGNEDSLVKILDELSNFACNLCNDIFTEFDKFDSDFTDGISSDSSANNNNNNSSSSISNGNSSDRRRGPPGWDICIHTCGSFLMIPITIHSTLIFIKHNISDNLLQTNEPKFTQINTYMMYATFLVTLVTLRCPELDVLSRIAITYPATQSQSLFPDSTTKFSYLFTPHILGVYSNTNKVLSLTPDTFSNQEKCNRWVVSKPMARIIAHLDNKDTIVKIGGKTYIKGLTSSMENIVKMNGLSFTEKVDAVEEFFETSIGTDFLNGGRIDPETNKKDDDIPTKPTATSMTTPSHIDTDNNDNDNDNDHKLGKLPTRIQRSMSTLKGKGRQQFTSLRRNVSKRIAGYVQKGKEFIPTVGSRRYVYSHDGTKWEYIPGPVTTSLAQPMLVENTDREVDVAVPVDSGGGDGGDGHSEIPKSKAQNNSSVTKSLVLNDIFGYKYLK